VPTFSLVSTQFEADQPLPVSASADGGSVSPPLVWSGFPPETKSFAVTCFDPDAPRPGGFWHWLVVNLPVETTSLPVGAGAPGGDLPGAAVTLDNDAGLRCYAGARPPEGDHQHRYFFAVHALDVPAVSLDPNARPGEHAAALAPHTIGRGVLVGTYQR
jgi:Raf kinase inhibitor-like YbhB/YbcL family protein